MERWVAFHTSIRFFHVPKMNAIVHIVAPLRHPSHSDWEQNSGINHTSNDTLLHRHAFSRRRRTGAYERR